jgi:hypothetical protein
MIVNSTLRNLSKPFLPALCAMTIAAVGAPASAAPDAHAIDLAGSWQFALDRDDRGLADH